MMPLCFVLKRLNLRITSLLLGPVCLLAFCSHAAAAKVEEGSDSIQAEIRCRADRTSVQIADPFEFFIEVTAKDGASVQFPSLPSQLGSFEVVDQQDLLGVPGDAGSDKSKWIRRLTLETLDTGELKIPPIEVSVRVENLPPERLATDPFFIDVASVLEPASDPAKFTDIRDVIDVSQPNVPSRSWIAWAAVGGAALISLVAGAVVIFRRRTRWTTAAEWAIGEIEELSAQSSNSISQLERIVRTYIEEEFHVPARSYSAQELQLDLKRQGASEGALQQLDEFLTRAEQAKYASLELSGSGYANAKDSVLKVIESLEGIPERKFDEPSMEVS